jgi:phosphatidylinositol alpha 1,6-mannosyltransferase
VGGVRDLVKDGVNGYTVQPDDETGLFLKIKELALDPEKRALFSQASKERAAYYSVDRMVRETLAVYTRVVRSRQAGSRKRNIILMEERNP